MSNHQEIVNKIIRLIGEAGGEISGADLREQLGVEEIDRRMAIAALRKDGRLSSEGATVNIVYRLEDGHRPAEAGHRIPNPRKPAKERKAKKAPKTRTAKIEKGKQLVIDQPAPIASRPMTLAVALDVTVVEDLRPIPRQHLRRVLALALSRPGDIGDSDREALCAIAEGAR